MDEPVGESSQATLGNVAIPEWMLKRRARLQAQVANEDTSTDSIESAGPKSEKPAVANSASIGAATTFPLLPKSTSPVGAEPLESPISDLPLGDEVAVGPTINEPTKSDNPFAIVTQPVISPPLVSSSPVTAKRPAKINLALPVIEAIPPAVLPWHQALRERWLGKDELRSYGVSFVMHLVAALLLSLVVFRTEVTEFGLNTLLATAGDGQGGDGLDDSQIFQIDTTGGQSAESLDTMLSANAVSSALGPSELMVPQGVGGIHLGKGQGAGEAEGEGNQVGDGVSVGGFKMPEGGKFVQKGSFTAWTVPADPAPFEDYKIIIQVTYKNRNQKLSKGDITGSVIGTDDYRKAISRYTAEFIPAANQVVVNIPGGAARVRDTIRVYSAVLKENQKLEIVF